VKRTWWQRFRSSTAHTQANIVCTIIIAIATVIYAFIAGCQLSSINKQLPSIRESADAAKNAASTADTELQLSNRPWVGINGPPKIIGSIHDNPSDLNVAYELVNVGKSYGLGVESVVWIAGGSSDGISLMQSDHCEQAANDLRRNLAQPPEAGRSSGSIIIPGGTEHIQVAPQAGAPSTPQENVYVLSCTVYSDPLKKVHLTQETFCFTSRYPQLKDIPVNCGQGNYAY
jgi:hypothetical protein